ncbi:site-specific integrase [Petroclostridium sp. X23]|uniref:site-specific integrase n=1 Tax=Petroclostridium sp. X23 TaxID=3045146 RepID=UPI0024AE2AE6|nr:site-specific integrase [Petroclostridium sp. X23]WHH60421.1 site-specific integrase [Petroclostridium sp. X23]
MASIRKRGANSYQITVSCGYDSEGKKIIKQKTVKRPEEMTDKQWSKELNKLALEFERAVEKGTFLDGNKITFAELTEKWLHDYGEKNLEETTLDNYREMLNKRILPAIGHIKLSKLQPTHLLDFYNNLQEPGMRLDYKYVAKPEFIKLMAAKTFEDVSKLAHVQPETISKIVKGNRCMSSTVDKLCSALDIKKEKFFQVQDGDKKLSVERIKHHHKTISTILTEAVNWQLIMNNPAERVRLPKAEKKEAKAYDEDQAEKLLSLIENEEIKYKLAIHIVLFTGCRLSELCGLEWSDIDTKNKTIRFRQASRYTKSQGVFTKKPKTESSDRTIAISKSLVKLINQYKLWQNGEKAKLQGTQDNEGDSQSSENPEGLWEEHNRLFTQWDGKPIFPSTPSRWFKKIRLKYDLPDLKFHELRHTNASLLIANNVDVRTVSKRLGHARTSITTDIYSHALRRPDKEAAEKLDNLFNKDKKARKRNSKQKQA